MTIVRPEDGCFRSPAQDQATILDFPSRCDVGQAVAPDDIMIA